MLGVGEDLSKNLHIVNRHDPVPVTALDRAHGGSLIGCLLRDEGSYVHGGTMIWMDVNGDFRELNPAYCCNERRMARLMAYICCCFVDNPVSDHRGTPYVQNLAKCITKQAGSTGALQLRCLDSKAVSGHV